MREQVAYVEGFKHKQHMALDRNFSSLRNLSFLHFQKLKTPEIKHHLKQDHGCPTLPYHTSQQPRLGKNLLLPTSFKLRFDHASQQTQSMVEH